MSFSKAQDLLRLAQMAASRRGGVSVEDICTEFGVSQDPAQYGEVIWRFAPETAERAAEFRFHPTQVLEPQDDGSLIVRFNAAGWLEMVVASLSVGRQRSR